MKGGEDLEDAMRDSTADEVSTPCSAECRCHEIKLQQQLSSINIKTPAYDVNRSTADATKYWTAAMQAKWVVHSTAALRLSIAGYDISGKLYIGEFYRETCINT